MRLKLHPNRYRASRKGLKMGDCQTCLVRKTFVGGKCITCGFKLPRERRAS